MSDDRKASTVQHGLPPLAWSTWPQVDVSPRHLIVLPLGSTEQHGPHLPLNTDTVIAIHLAREVQQEFPSAGLAPAMPYGASGEHADFPGTLSIGTEALTNFLIEFARHAAIMWRHILVVNAHGGNADALQAATKQMRSEGKSLTVYHAASGGPKADPHAGFRETSLMLHLEPRYVRSQLMIAGATGPLSEMMPRLRAHGVRAVSENGVLGDPHGANADHGRKIFAAMRAELLRVVAAAIGQ